MRVRIVYALVSEFLLGRNLFLGDIYEFSLTKASTDKPRGSLICDLFLPFPTVFASLFLIYMVENVVFFIAFYSPLSKDIALSQRFFFNWLTIHYFFYLCAKYIKSFNSLLSIILFIILPILFIVLHLLFIILLMLFIILAILVIILHLMFIILLMLFIILFKDCWRLFS